MPPDRPSDDLHPRRIFLSYGRDSLISFAARLKIDLIKRGYDVWFDEDRIQPGDDWEQYIEEGLKWASSGDNGCMILLMTPHSVRRPHGFCLNELSRAIYVSLDVIPVMLVWCEPPLSLCRVQWLDMMDCVPAEERQDRYNEKIDILIHALEGGKRDYEGFQSTLISTLKPLSYDAEIRYNLDRFTGREWLFNEIGDWLASGTSRIFWISGSPGVGKSAISAWLCAHLRDVGAFHFCRYDNVQKTDPRRCITSIAYQLSTQLPEYEERLKSMRLENIGDLNARTLFDHLILQPLWGIQKPNRKLVIIIDGLDEASRNGTNELAGFLASELERIPEWIRLIITSRPEPEVLGPMQAYTPYMLNISDPRNEQDILNYLARELKKYYSGGEVPAPIIGAVAKKSEGLFLYTEWILKELDTGRLSLNRLDDFPQGLGGIYLKFFERQFPDVTAWETTIRPKLEIIVVLQEPVELKKISRTLNWSVHDERRFRKSLGSLFQFDRGFVQPFHQSLIEWLTNENKFDPYFISRMEGHKAIAQYGLNRHRKGTAAGSRYLLSYLSMHMFTAGMIDELAEVLGDPAFIKAAWENDKYNALKQWTFVEEHTALKMVDVYRPVIENPAKVSDKYLLALADLLKNSFHFESAIKLFDYLIIHYRNNTDRVGLQESLGGQAWIMMTRCDYDAATRLFKEQERICREIGNTVGLQYSIHCRATILSAQNDIDGAMVLLKEQEQISRETGDANGLLESLAEQCGILRFRGNYNEVLLILKERERICGEIGNMGGYLKCLPEHCMALCAIGDLEESLRQLKKLEKIGREIGNQEYLRASLTGQEIVLLYKGDFEKALALNEEADAISRRIGNNYYLQECLCQRATELRAKGDPAGALECIEKAEALCSELCNKFGSQALAGEKGAIFRMRGEPEIALEHYQEQEKICREIGHRRDLAVCLYGQAAVLRMKGDRNGALALHDESERILREVGHMYYLQECLGEKALTLFEMEDFLGAMALLEEQERICKEIGATQASQSCHRSRQIIKNAGILKKKKEPAF